jgi:signal transduction histidine kinase
MTVPILLIAWALTALTPLAWWSWQRRRVDVWRWMPVPCAILAAGREPLARSGPDNAVDWRMLTPLPPPGVAIHARTADGTPVAIAGVPRGALAVALTEDPAREHRARALDDLLPGLAHEVHSPLSAVSGHLALIGEHPMTTQQRASLDIVSGQVDRLGRLTKDLLELTRVRARSADRLRCHAAALAEDAVASLLPLADEVRATLRVNVAPGDMVINAAPGDIIRSLQVLIQNSLRHGCPQSSAAGRHRVEVHVHPHEGSAVFAVVDSGPGIPPERLVALSAPFARGDSAAPGTGLGLAIAAEILAAHGSRLEAHPSPDGSSLTFRLRLDAAR